MQLGHQSHGSNSMISSYKIKKSPTHRVLTKTCPYKVIVGNLVCVWGGVVQLVVSTPIKTHPKPYQPSLIQLVVAPAAG